MSYITSIGTANPANRFAQNDIANFMIRAMGLNDDDARKLRALYRATGIETRYSVIEDYGRNDGFDFFPNNKNLEPFPTTKKRLELFRKYSLQLSISSIRNCLERIPSFNKGDLTHLVVVSCTGMYAPGLDIDLVKELGLNSTIQRTCLNFMGCYAAFNAIKLADSFCTEYKAKVLVVCIELCSIHFQKEKTENNMLANALFADGSAALLIESQPREGINLKPLSFHCDLAINGEREMAWSIGDLGFEMKLSTYVPDVIGNGIKELTRSLLQKTSISFSKINFFAIHPGGKKILDVVEKELNLTKEQNRFAHQVLRDFGNMSSPTVLFVLNEIVKILKSSDEGKTILSFAFGPGLTLESMLLKIESH